MHDQVRTTVFVRVHGLETQTIFDLAKDRLDRSRWDVRSFARDAGALPPPGEVCPRVVLIGVADAEIARRLRAVGKTVLAIDNACHFFNDGSRSDSRAGMSRIEQVLEVFGLSLDLSLSREDQQRLEQIAANARGSIPRLVETICRQHPGANREEKIDAVLALREQAAAVRARLLSERSTGKILPADARTRNEVCAAIGTTMRLRTFATNRRLNNDPELILVSAPERYRLVLEDAIYAHVWQRGGRLDARLDILALYTGAAGSADPAPALPLVHIAFHGAAAHLPLFADILAPATRRDWQTERLHARAVITEGLCCRLADRLGTEGPALAGLADRLLDHLLIGNRPLRAWRTSFLQPLRLADPAKFDDERRRLLACARNPPPSRPKIMPAFAKEEERSYFLSHVRRHIVPTAKEVEDDEALDTALLSFRIKTRCLVLRITRNDGAPERRLPICAQYVHLFAAGCLVVEWVVAEETDEPLPPETDGQEPRDEERCWHRYLQCAETAGPTLIDLLDLTFFARFVYSGFIAEDPKKQTKVELLALDDNEKVLATLPLWSEVSKDQPFCGWFAALLKEGPGRFCGGIVDSPKRELLSDDRARVLSSVVAAGAPPRLNATRDAFNAILARLRMIDQGGTAFDYDPEFARNELRKGSYDRFADMGTSYGISPHSFVALTFGSYGLKAIHKNHMRTMYRRMFLLTLFYRAILQALAHDVSKALPARWPKLPGRYLALRPQILTFTNAILGYMRLPFTGASPADPHLHQPLVVPGGERPDPGRRAVSPDADRSRRRGGIRADREGDRRHRCLSTRLF